MTHLKLSYRLRKLLFYCFLFCCFLFFYYFSVVFFSSFILINIKLSCWSYDQSLMWSREMITTNTQKKKKEYKIIQKHRVTLCVVRLWNWLPHILLYYKEHYHCVHHCDGFILKITLHYSFVMWDFLIGFFLNSRNNVKYKFIYLITLKCINSKVIYESGRPSSS